MKLTCIGCIKIMVKQDKSFTVEEFEMKFGWPCELCNHYDMEDNICAKGRHPREYTLEDGPNESIHAVRFCMLFSKWEADIEVMGEAIARDIRCKLDCGFQQYC